MNDGSSDEFRSSGSFGVLIVVQFEDPGRQQFIDLSLFYECLLKVDNNRNVTSLCKQAID